MSKLINEISKDANTVKYGKEKVFFNERLNESNVSSDVNRDFMLEVLNGFLYVDRF